MPGSICCFILRNLMGGERPVSGKSHNAQVSSIFVRPRSVARGLVLGLTLILSLMAGGFAFLLYHFQRSLSDTTHEITDSTTRDTLVLASYRLSIETYNLAEQAYRHPSALASIKTLYIDKKTQFRSIVDEYRNLLGTAASKESFLIRERTDRFLKVVDSVLVKTDQVMEAELTSAGKLRLSKDAASLFDPVVMDLLRRVRLNQEALLKLEMEENLSQLFNAQMATQNMANRWFVTSGLLFLVAVGLAVMVVVLGRRSTAEMQRFRTIFEYSINPIEITDPSGGIVYVNAAFEQWTTIARTELIGKQAYEGVISRDFSSDTKSFWETVAESLRAGKPWLGEVDVHHRNGAVSYSSLIVSPVLDQNGRLRETIGMHHDLTEERKLLEKVEETRRQYQSIVESSLDGIVIVQEGKLVFANPAAVRILEYESAADMESLNFSDTIAPASRPFFLIDYHNRAVGEDIMKNSEMKGLTKRGKLIDLDFNARIIKWNEIPAMQASFRDITERKMMERQLAFWLWEQEALSKIDRQLVGVVDLQKVLDIILQHVTILTRSQFVGVAIVDAEDSQGRWKAMRGNRQVMTSDTFKLTPLLRRILAARKHHIIEDCRTNSNFPLSDIPVLQTEDIVALGLFPLLVKGEPRGQVVVGFRKAYQFHERDVRVLLSMAEKTSIALTNGEMYEDLLHRERELEFLSGARVQAQEDERRRISREIHDGLGQMLTAIKFSLEILEDEITAGEDERTRIVDIKELLDNVMKEAREISYNLMPSVLDDFGLAPGLQLLCEQFSKGRELKVSFHAHDLADRFAPEIETGLYRIAQEALNNIAKHANATEVEVQIVRHKDKLRLSIEDDGKGMNLVQPARHSIEEGGMGLVSMKERAASFKGTLIIDSTPGKGTTINVEIPLS